MEPKRKRKCTVLLIFCIGIAGAFTLKERRTMPSSDRLAEKNLKVVGNENGGGLGGWLLFEDSFGPCRSMSVYFLILLSSFLQRISFSVL